MGKDQLFLLITQRVIILDRVLCTLQYQLELYWFQELQKKKKAKHKTNIPKSMPEHKLVETTIQVVCNYIKTFLEGNKHSNKKGNKDLCPMIFSKVRFPVRYLFVPLHIVDVFGFCLHFHFMALKTWTMNHNLQMQIEDGAVVQWLGLVRSKELVSYLVP